MHSDHPHIEPDAAKAAEAKYGLIVAALCAATVTVALAIASKLAPWPGTSWADAAIWPAAPDIVTAIADFLTRPW